MNFEFYDVGTGVRYDLTVTQPDWTSGPSLEVLLLMARELPGRKFLFMIGGKRGHGGGVPVIDYFGYKSLSDFVTDSNRVLITTRTFDPRYNPPYVAGAGGTAPFTSFWSAFNKTREVSQTT